MFANSRLCVPGLKTIPVQRSDPQAAAPTSRVGEQFQTSARCASLRGVCGSPPYVFRSTP